jgi:hypothetical protein
MAKKATVKKTVARKKAAKRELIDTGTDSQSHPHGIRRTLFPCPQKQSHANTFTTAAGQKQWSSSCEGLLAPLEPLKEHGTGITTGDTGSGRPRQERSLMRPRV